MENRKLREKKREEEVGKKLPATLQRVQKCPKA
jgi:hypothetical protein